MKEKKELRGGPRRGQGRHPIQQGEHTVTVSLRMTERQRDKLREIGGAKAVRDWLDCIVSARML